MDNHASRRMHPNDLQGFCLSCVGSKGNSILANISMLTKWANYTALLVLALLLQAFCQGIASNYSSNESFYCLCVYRRTTCS